MNTHNNNNNDNTNYDNTATAAADIAKEINEPANILNPNVEHKQQPRPNINNNSTVRTNTPPKQEGSSREINHLYQLSYIDKELVKVLFREAYVRGWRMDQIPTYIFIRSKINATYRLCQSLKKMQYDDDRHWFYELARDQIAYLGRYRVSIDRLEQLDKEMWLIIMNSKIEPAVRIQATKESHSINRTLNLLLRDLPFITNLSKLYDLSELDPNQRTLKKLAQSKDLINNHDYDKEKIDFERTRFTSLNNSLVQNILEKTKDNRIKDEILLTKKTVDADVIEEMQRQINTFGYDTDPKIKQLKEKQRKEIEEKYILHNLAKLDQELSQIDSNDETNKVDKMAQKYRSTMVFLNELIPPEQRDAIKRVRELTDNNEEEEEL